MIHYSKNQRSSYFYYINKVRILNNWKLFIAALLPVLLIFLVETDILPSRAKYSSSIIEPVALVITESGTGTAFLVGRTHLITARHVVEDISIGHQIDLLFDKVSPKISTTASLVWKDETQVGANAININDFAVLRLVNPSDLPANFPRLKLGVSSGIDLMTRVVLIGYPSGSFSIKQGQISNTESHGLDVFQIDVSAWPGSSGGPLIEESTNEVIGILGFGLREPFVGINVAYKIDNALRTFYAKGIDIDE